MRKWFLFMAVLLSAAVFVSCEDDETVTPDSGEDVVETDSLVFVPQVNATDSTNGFVAHYEGTVSHMMFEDAEGKTPLEGGIIFASRFCLTKDTLNADLSGDFTEEMLEEFRDGHYLVGDDVSTRGAGDKSIWGSLAKCLAANIGKAIGKKAADTALKFLFGEEEDNQNLDTIYSRLDDIDREVTSMMKAINKQEVATALQKRYDDHHAMLIHTGDRMQKIMQIYENRKGDTLSVDEYNEIAYWVKDWKDTPMGSGHDALEYNIEIMENANGSTYTCNGKTLPELYDQYADYCYPWEHEGYLFREAARLTDYMLVFDGYVMCKLYAMITGYDVHSTRLENAFDNYIKLVEAHPVVYNDDLFVFNFSTPKVAFQKQIAYMDFSDFIVANARRPMWSTGTSSENVTSGMDEMISYCANTTVEHFATYQNYLAIYEAINNGLSTPKTLGQIFNEVGFTVEPDILSGTVLDITTDRTYFITQNTGSYSSGSEGSWPNYNGAYYRYKIFIWKCGHDSNKDFFHARGSVNQKSVQSEHASIFDNMNIVKKDGTISSFGTYANNNFFTLITSDFNK